MLSKVLLPVKMATCKFDYVLCTGNFPVEILGGLCMETTLVL